MSACNQILGNLPPGPTDGSGGVHSGGDAGDLGGDAGDTGDGGGSGGAAEVTGGSTSTGGSEATGGSTNTGGSEATGGSTNTGGGEATGGSTGTGGEGPDTCEIGSTMGNEVIFIGESFIATSMIPEVITDLARAAGSLAPSDSYVDRSASGTWLGNGATNSIPNQYLDNSAGVRFVLMDGGANDCWQGGEVEDRVNALDAAAQLFEDMEANGVEKVVYFFYPDPVGSQWVDLTACLDLLRPEMKTLCEAQVAPECYWVDLRETWEGHPEYTGDGIHADDDGYVPTATAIFESMQENCVAP